MLCRVEIQQSAFELSQLSNPMQQFKDDIFRPFIPHDVAYMVAREKMPLVKAWRIRLNLTIEELASAAHMPPEEVSLLERKQNNFSPTLMKIAGVMNLEINQLMDSVH